MDVIMVIFTVVIALATVVYAVLTAVLARETIRLREVETEPQICVYLESHKVHDFLLELVVRNIGKAPAYDLRWDFDANAPLVATLREQKFDLAELGFFRGTDYMAPGREYRTVLGSSHTILAKDDIPPLGLCVTFHNKQERQYSDTFLLDPQEFWGARYSSGPDIAKKLDEVKKELHAVVMELRSIKAGLSSNVEDT